MWYAFSPRFVCSCRRCTEREAGFILLGALICAWEGVGEEAAGCLAATSASIRKQAGLARESVGGSWRRAASSEIEEEAGSTQVGSVPSSPAPQVRSRVCHTEAASGVREGWEGCFGVGGAQREADPPQLRRCVALAPQPGRQGAFIPLSQPDDCAVSLPPQPGRCVVCLPQPKGAVLFVCLSQKGAE